jgi:hypothetical protein
VSPSPYSSHSGWSPTMMARQAAPACPVEDVVFGAEIVPHRHGKPRRRTKKRRDAISRYRRRLAGGRTTDVSLLDTRGPDRCSAAARFLRPWSASQRGFPLRRPAGAHRRCEHVLVRSRQKGRST